MSKKSRSIRWLFNPLMLWGAVLGYLIGVAIVDIRETWGHEGPGYVRYDQPTGDVELSEEEYKRHCYVMDGMMLFIGLFVWGLVAYWAKQSRSPAPQRQPDPPSSTP